MWRTRGGQALTFALGDADPIRGRALTVQLPAGVAEVVIAYRTAPAAEALQWLAPSQTAGGRHPYLFSQGQAILTRTWIPNAGQPRHPADLHGTDRRAARSCAP